MDRLQEEDTVEKEKKESKKRMGKATRRVLAVALAVLCFLGGMGFCWLLLDPELRSLVRLKDRVQSDYYEEITDEEFYGTLFNAVNEDLLDEYSQYMTGDEYDLVQSEAKGEQNGVGLVFLIKTAEGNDQMLVTRVCGNSPAEEAGIVEGESVVAFGKSEESLKQSVVFDEFKAFVDGLESGEAFFVTARMNGADRTVRLYKSDYVENYVFYRTNAAFYRLTGGNAADKKAVGSPLAALANDTAYIRLTQFNGNAADEFEGAMELFKQEGKKNLVLDLRSNGGGFLDIMQDIASYFCKNSDKRRPVVAVANYNDSSETFSARGNYYDEYFSADSRITVLADNTTASASECLIGCMLDYGAIAYGDICLSYRSGEAKTYGKGIMQTTYPIRLLEGDAVKLTTAKICWPVSGNCIHGRGVLPEDGTKTAAESYGADTEIVAALQALSV
ncbi:MAG: hypothetical protein IJ514_01275 [Clostridia bacterium]|nr:hypothetical protein [Clostridia bacterium]